MMVVLKRVASLLLIASLSFYISIHTLKVTELPEISDKTSVAAIVPSLCLAVDSDDAIAIAKTLYGECRGCSQTEQAAVAWCILNRVDDSGECVLDVVSAPHQFVGYNEQHPVWPELYALAVDVLYRWELEHHGISDVGRVLPKGYKWFTGSGVHNYFRNAYRGGNIWDWPLTSPYVKGMTLYESNESYYG